MIESFDPDRCPVAQGTLFDPVLLSGSRLFGYANSPRWVLYSFSEFCFIEKAVIAVASFLTL